MNSQQRGPADSSRCTLPYVIDLVKNFSLTLIRKAGSRARFVRLLCHPTGTILREN